MKIKRLNTKSKIALILGLLLLTQDSLFAQTIGTPTQTLTGMTPLTLKLMYWKGIIKRVLDVAVAVFAIVGGFIIFIQYMQGNEQAQKNFIKFVIGLAVFALVDGIVTVFVP